MKDALQAIYMNEKVFPVIRYVEHGCNWTLVSINAFGNARQDFENGRGWGRIVEIHHKYTLRMYSQKVHLIFDLSNTSDAA
jgi:hypothetical protein